MSHLFTGKELDTSGLYNYGARYYHPGIAHFTQPDPIIQNIYDPQALNHYAYCRNNPLIYTDPTGLIFGSGIGGIGGIWDSIGNIWNDFQHGISAGWGGFSSAFSLGISTIGRWGMQMGRGLRDVFWDTPADFWEGFGSTMFIKPAQSAWNESKIWGNALGMGMGQIGRGLSNFGQATWKDTQIFGSALGIGFNYGVQEMRTGIKPDSGFGQRFWNQFYKDRLPVINWFSPIPLPFPKGLAVSVGTTGAAVGLENLAYREATRNFTSFSGTRDFAYVRGYYPQYLTVGKLIGNVSWVLTATGLGADIGTAIESAIHTWKDGN